MLEFFKRKGKKKGVREEEAQIEVVLGSFPGYSEDPDDIDPEELDPNMRKIGGDFVIPSE